MDKRKDGVFLQGSNPKLDPFMLTSHLDVVPVDEERWSRDPFLGEVVIDSVTGLEVIWGRGAIDDKGGVIVSLIKFGTLQNTKWSLIFSRESYPLWKF